MEAQANLSKEVEQEAQASYRCREHPMAIRLDAGRSSDPWHALGMLKPDGHNSGRVRYGQLVCGRSELDVGHRWLHIQRWMEMSLVRMQTGSGEPLSSTHVRHICDLPLSTLDIALPFDHADHLSAKRGRVASDFQQREDSPFSLPIVNVGSELDYATLVRWVLLQDGLMVLHVAVEICFLNIAILVHFDSFNRDKS